MAFFKGTSISLVLAAMVLLALATTHVEASQFLAYSGPRCSGNAERLSRCGCSNINRRSGYQFTYTGQTAAVYNQPGCSGVAHTVPGSDPAPGVAPPLDGRASSSNVNHRWLAPAGKSTLVSVRNTSAST